MTAKNRNLSILMGDEGSADSEAFLTHIELTIMTLMNAKKINQSELAKLMGVSRSRVSQLLNRNKNVTLKTLAKLFEVLEEEARLSCPTLEGRKSVRAMSLWRSHRVKYPYSDIFISNTSIQDIGGLRIAAIPQKFIPANDAYSVDFSSVNGGLGG